MEFFQKVIFIIFKSCPLLTEGKPCRGEIILLIYNLSDLALLAQITPNFSLGLAGLKN